MKTMEYRTLPHGGEPISIIGLGTSSIQEASEQEIEETVRYALERGIRLSRMAGLRIAGRMSNCWRRMGFIGDLCREERGR